MEYILNEQELVCYKTLAKSTGMSISDLSRITGIFRPQLYKILALLDNQDLIVTHKSGKRILYAVSSPDNLRAKIESSVQATESAGKKLFSEVFGNSSIQQIHGRNDIIQVFNDLVENLDEQETYYSYATGSPTTAESYFPANFRKTRDRKNLWSYVVTTQPILRKPRFSLEIKTTDNPNAPKDCLWLAYAEKLIFIDYATESGYIITDKKMSEFQQSIIRSMFKMDN